MRAAGPEEGTARLPCIFISTATPRSVVDIAEEQEPDYQSARIETVGFLDPYGMEGLAVLRSDDGKEFHVRAFSGEVAKHIVCMSDADAAPIQIPSVYSMISDICEENEIVLVKVKVYQSGSVLRANLYLTGKKDIVLKNYRASDAIALASLYKIPILVRKNLLKNPDEAENGQGRALGR